MRSSFGVRLRVWFRIHDSGTRQRAANSAESISFGPSFPPVRDIFGTSAVSGVIVSTTYHRVAVTLPLHCYQNCERHAFGPTNRAAERPSLPATLKEGRPPPRRCPCFSRLFHCYAFAFAGL